MIKENNPLFMTRKEFEEYKKNSKFCRYPYEFYRVFPLLNHKQLEKLIIFMRENDSPIEILKETVRILEEDTI